MRTKRRNMRYKRFVRPLSVLILLFFVLSVHTASFEGLKVTEVRFEGNISTKKEILRATVTQKKGDDYTASGISDSIKSLYELGLFSEVRADAQKDGSNGVVVTYTILEYPTVKSVKYEGLKKITLSDLEEQLNDILEPGSIYSPAAVNDIAFIIETKYFDEGYLEVDISVNEELDKKANSVAITFVITEGARTYVRSVLFEGNEFFSEKKLNARMETKAKSWYRSGLFDEEKYYSDLDKLIDLYKDNGYIRATVVSHSVGTNLAERARGKKTIESKELDIKIVIREGQQYTFKGYQVSGYTLFPDETILEQLVHESNVIYKHSQLIRDIMGVQQLYAGRGYIFAQVIPEEIVDDENLTIAFHINVTEGEIAHVENIIIRGNTKTEDQVIRREISLKEGDIFDSDKLRRSQEKIYNLGFFKDVALDVRPGSAEGLMNLIVDVEEQQTGMVTLGATFSSATKLGGYEEISENNFLGKGYRLHERIEFQQEQQKASVGFSSPWIFGGPTSFDSSLYYLHRRVMTDNISNTLYLVGINEEPSKTTNFKKYFRNEYGIQVGLGRRINDYMKAGMGYNFQFYRNYDLDPVYATNVNEGTFQRNVFRLYYEYDSRDNVFNPTRGFHFRQDIETSLGLKDNDTYNKYTADIGYYARLPFKFVFVAHTFVGAFGKSLFLPGSDVIVADTDKFYLGSAETIRGGYSTGSVVRQWPEYGQIQHYMNLEFRFPIAEQMLWGVMFMDSGMQWGDQQDFDFDLRKYAYSLGAGLRIQIPMLPLRFYFSYRFGYDEYQGWHFIDDVFPKDVKFDLSVGGLF